MTVNIKVKGYYECAFFELQPSFKVNKPNWKYLRFSSRENTKALFHFYKDEMQQGEKPTKGNVGVSHIKKTGFTGEHWEQFERYLPRVVYSCVKVEGGLEIDPLTAEQMALVKEEEILDV